MRRSTSALLTLIAVFSLLSLVSAQRSGFGEACDISNNHLDANTWALVTDCDATTYCADNGTCAHKGCRKDIYPYGYNGVAFDQLPTLCPAGQFCPDEGSECLDQIAVGEPCQKDRDDECQFPPNFKQYSNFLNVNGSVCLNFTCEWSNVTLGQTCIPDNTVYTAYTDSGASYAFIVSRDNCATGFYCDGTSKQCLSAKRFGETCAGNKECFSYHCTDQLKCGSAADEPIHPPNYAYVLVGLGILLLIVGVMVSLWFLHKRTREENQIRLEQYYNEQVAYRQSIMSMSHAKNSLLSLPVNTHPDVARQSLLGDEAFGYTSAVEPNTALPPNMRRDSSAAWSESDSEVLLVDQNNKGDLSAPGRPWR